jgi:SAM-dependent methyltransferase
MQPKPSLGEYSLATGEAAANRLHSLHRVYSPAGRRVLLRAGLQPGMRVADLGCGVGATTRMIAEMVGPSGHVTGLDMSAAQLEQARDLCKASGLNNADFVEASAIDTGPPRASFDIIYCRFLLLHLVDPPACLREMFALLKPGGTVVIEDGDLTTAHSIPASSLNSFADLFGRLGPTRGLNYAMANNLFHLVSAAGFPEPDIEIHQPAVARGEDRFLLKWSVDEASEAYIGAGLVRREEMQAIRDAMDRDSRNLDLLVLMPKMFLVWAKKPA